MQFQGQGKPPVGIVFDADIGSTIDDALALAMLFGFQGKNESRVLSVSTTRSSLNAAIFADVLVRFYTGEPGPFGGAMPIGLCLSGKMAAPTPMLDAVAGNAKYPRGILKMNDTADPVALIRNALSAQFDQNAIVVLTGPATNLAGLLALPGTPALIAQKARTLVVAADALTMSDIPGARRLFAEWPTPIVVAGGELGDDFPFPGFPFPGAGIEKDFAWSEAHPLVAAYRAYRPMPYDAPALAMAAALYAVRPQENYFKLSDPGVVTVADDGRVRLAPAPSGKHRTLIADPAQKERIQQIYAETASTRPVGRAQRFRPPQKKQ
ncbi:MAG: hypothetical protein NTW28_03865 [Candidatus Solibacter sp.]|nr:hypothetical protein [Candidatus Solibacter sp.]